MDGCGGVYSAGIDNPSLNTMLLDCGLNAPTSLSVSENYNQGGLQY